MQNIKLYEIYDERHILIFSNNILYFEEVQDDLSLKCLSSSDGFLNIIQILKYADKKFLFLLPNLIALIPLEENLDVGELLSYFFSKDYNFFKAINLPKGKIAVSTFNSDILIFNILSNNDIQLQTKIDMNNNNTKYFTFSLDLYYVEKTNELLIRDMEKIFFLNLEKYCFNHVIKEENNYYLWGSEYTDGIGRNSLENNFCMINDDLLAMTFTRNVIKLIDLNTHEIIKNFIYSHDNITSLIKPKNFEKNNFLCSLYSYDCHGGIYFSFSKANIIEYGRKKEDYPENFGIEYTDKISLFEFPVSIRLLRDGVVLMICFNSGCFDNKFSLRILKYT